MSVPEVDTLTDELIGHYARSWDRVLSELERLSPVPTSEARRVARLREVARTIADEMDNLARQTPARVGQAVQTSFELGYAHGTIAAGASAVDFTLIDRGAVRLFADGLTDELLAASDNVSRTTRRLVRTLVRDEGLHTLIAGDTAVATGRRIERLAGREGVYAVQYADGSYHGMREYAQMAARTTTAQAYNGAELAGAASEGVKWWEIFDGPDCGLSFHGDPTIASGMIVERDVADRYLIAHPNCRRSFGPRPDITSAEQAAGTPGSVTDEQLTAQRAADAERRRLLEAAGARRERLARRSRPSRDRRGYRAARGARGAANPAPRHTAAQREAVSAYTSQEGLAINRKLRRGRTLGDDDARRVQLLDEAVATAPPLASDATFYRATRLEDVLEGVSPDRIVGTTFRDHGFTSTSAARESAAKFPGELLEVRVPRGTRALDVGGMGVSQRATEREWLLGRGSLFRVADRNPDGSWVLDVINDG